MSTYNTPTVYVNPHIALLFTFTNCNYTGWYPQPYVGGVTMTYEISYEQIVAANGYLELTAYTPGQGTSYYTINIGGPASSAWPPSIYDSTSGGTFTVGDTLATNPGQWNNDSGTYYYQWYRCTDSPAGDPATDAACAAISGATNPTYTLQQADAGDTISLDMSDLGTDTVVSPVVTPGATPVIASSARSVLPTSPTRSRH